MIYLCVCRFGSDDPGRLGDHLIMFSDHHQRPPWWTWRHLTDEELVAAITEQEQDAAR